jgi:uncharacterized membrane protein
MRTKNANKFFILIALLFSFAISFAQPRPQHHENDSMLNHDTAQAATVQSPSTHNGLANQEPVESFPNLHPLVVHFPIVLLIVAAFMQLIAFRINNKSYHSAIAILAMLGAVSAYLAGSVFHAHTVDNLSSKAMELFEQHEFYANLSLWTGLAGALLKTISLFRTNEKWFEALVMLSLAASAVCVSIAGHHGAELVYKYGIGPKGNLLEQHHH